MNEEEILLNYLKDENWKYFHEDGVPYKIIFMQDRDILIKYITQLQNNWNELKKKLERRIKSYEDRKELGKGYELTEVMEISLACDKRLLKDMQEMEQGKDD